MSRINVLTLRLAVLQALTDRIKQVNDETRIELLGQFATFGAEKAGATLPDGTRVASVTVNGVDKRAKAKVVDPSAFLRWVKENRPDEVQETVRDSYRRSVLTEVESTCEEVPGVELSDPAPFLKCTPAKGGKDAIAEAWRTGALSLPEVLELPAGGDEQ